MWFGRLKLGVRSVRRCLPHLAGFAVHWPEPHPTPPPCVSFAPFPWSLFPSRRNFWLQPPGAGVCAFSLLPAAEPSGPVVICSGRGPSAAVCQLTTYICHLPCHLCEAVAPFYRPGDQGSVKWGSCPKVYNLVAKAGLEPRSVCLGSSPVLLPHLPLFCFSRFVLLRVLHSRPGVCLKCCFPWAHYHRPAVRAWGLGPGLCTLEKLPRLVVCRPHQETLTRVTLSALVPRSGDGVPLPRALMPLVWMPAELPSGRVLVTSPWVCRGRAAGRAFNLPSSRMCGAEVSGVAFTPSHKQLLLSLLMRF